MSGLQAAVEMFRAGVWPAVVLIIALKIGPHLVGDRDIRMKNKNAVTGETVFEAWTPDPRWVAIDRDRPAVHLDEETEAPLEHEIPTEAWQPDPADVIENLDLPPGSLEP